jgi:phosphoribosylaminoimidazolecarboxamide formyltransferase/IMP cyclohydrolase
VKRVLISTYDKTGLASFAKKLVKKGYEIVSTGGTSKHLKDNGLEVTEVKEITKTEEMLGGRVKTLHPNIFGGILARESDDDTLAKYNISRLEMVICNLYPFSEVISKSTVTINEAIENIDIGGVALLRAAAKNFKYVTVVPSIEDYDWIAEKIENDSLTYNDRLLLARKAFTYTSAYDAAINNYFSQQLEKEEELPHNIAIHLQRLRNLRYGENPHQKAALYSNGNKKGSEPYQKHQGKKISYNNLVDIDSAINIVNSFKETVSVVIKHTNPCGIAIGDNTKQAFQRALSTDPMSAFGGIIGFNRKVTAETASEIVKSFKEVVVAPSYEDEALDIFKKKKNLRVISAEIRENIRLDYRKTFAGWLLQEGDNHEIVEKEWEFVSNQKPTEQDLNALRFAWKVVGFVKSNSIVITNETKTLGIGAGQMSRIDAAELSVKKAHQAELNVKNGYMASDGFFPFRDSIDFAAKVGIRAVIEPGGSIRDKEVTEAANEKNIILVFSHRRHFRH